MQIGTIVCIDEAGNEFTKPVYTKIQDKRILVSVGYAKAWYIRDIKKPRPGSDRLFIDATGAKHQGFPVWCSNQELIDIIT